MGKQIMTDAQTIKQFFTESEWNLIYDLICSNSEWKEDEECKDHDSIIGKIHKLHNNKINEPKTYDQGVSDCWTYLYYELGMKDIAEEMYDWVVQQQEQSDD
jgi:hypothetical protein